MAEYVTVWRDHEPTKLHWGVPVVRCRDCKCTAPYGDGIECLGPLVQTWDHFNDQPLHNPVRPDGFCAWGVPREVDR